MHKVVQKSQFISMVWSLHCKALTSRPPASTMDSRWPGPVITHSNPFEKNTFVDPNGFISFMIFSIVLEGFCLHLRRCVFRGGNPPLIRAANGISGHLR